MWIFTRNVMVMFIFDQKSHFLRKSQKTRVFWLLFSGKARNIKKKIKIAFECIFQLKTLIRMLRHFYF